MYNLSCVKELHNYTFCLSFFMFTVYLKYEMGKKKATVNKV